MRVIAEGVETVGQKTALQRFGCRLMQGYYYAKPVSTTRLMTMLHESMNADERR